VQSDFTKFYERQVSLTEWFEAIGHPDAAKLRLEDNDKRERLDVLNKLIGLPFDKPVQFSAKSVAERSPVFKKYLEEHGDELCAVRIIPDDPKLPKFRMRGHSVADGTKWFDEQKIDSRHYRIDFVPHSETDWATIFVVSKQGVFGELTRGEHNELTQGLYRQHEPITFQFDFKTWTLSRGEPGAIEHLKDILVHLNVQSAAKQKIIKKQLSATFHHNYLAGYFETTASDERGIWFIDFNRLLGDMYGQAAPLRPSPDAIVIGRSGSPGKTIGIVRIVEPDALSKTKLKKTDILVCSMTTPDYLPLMQQAAAIITDLGGVLSHAAIIARELKKPCITATNNATTKLVDGQKIIVDADNGLVLPA
jgi:phosphohistidine swiveling domain-containing protein